MNYTIDPCTKHDGKHTVVNDIKFSNGAELHRFNNPAGVPYSAIYENGVEMMSCERSREAGMVDAYRSRI